MWAPLGGTPCPVGAAGRYPMCPVGAAGRYPVCPDGPDIGNVIISCQELVFKCPHIIYQRTYRGTG